MRYLFLLTGFFALLAFPAQAGTVSLGSGTQGGLSPTCDATVMQSHEAHAWLQAQREISQNANLIFKQDSVLQYTCFDRVLGHMGWAADRLFSDNVTSVRLFGPVPPWTPTPMSPFGPQPPGGIFNAGNMERTLRLLVEDALVQYIMGGSGVGNGNFEHLMLGGRSSIATVPPATVTSAQYNCDVMNRVWTSAKCYNFQTIMLLDDFFTFAEYAVADRRALPTPCDPAAWNDVMAVALTSPPWMTPAWVAQNSPSYLGRLNPANCAAIVPVKTGIRIKPVTGSEYDDAVCPAPGCWYNPASPGRCQAP